MSDFTEEEIAAEINRIRGFTYTGAALAHGVQRVFIRTLRVLCGLVLAIGGLWAFGNAWETLDKPFATQSFLGMVGGIAVGYFAIMLFVWAWGAAFGAGPPSQTHYQLRSTACANLARRAQ